MTEIDIAVLFRICWKYKNKILIYAFIGSLFGLGLGLSISKTYEAKTILKPIIKDKNTGGADTLSGLGGLASIAGIGLSGGTEKDTNIAFLRSYKFTSDFFKESGFSKLMFPERWDKKEQKWLFKPWQSSAPTTLMAYNKFDEKVRFIREDNKTGLITLSIEWHDPEIAATWANTLVEKINEYLRKKAISQAEARIKFLEDKIQNTKIIPVQNTIVSLYENEMRFLVTANVDDYYAFEVIDPAIIPEAPIRPKIIGLASMFLLIGLGIGIIHSLFLARSSDKKQNST